MERLNLVETKPEEPVTASTVESDLYYAGYESSPMPFDTKDFSFELKKEYHNCFLKVEPGKEWIFSNDLPTLDVLASAGQGEQDFNIDFFNMKVPVPPAIGIYNAVTNVVIGLQRPFIYRLSGVPVSTVYSKHLPVELEQQLERFRQLSEGWDGYGGCPVSLRAIEEAKSVLLTAIQYEDLESLVPLVAPTSHGGVGIEWSMESGRELLLEISSQGDISYLLVEPMPNGSETETEDVVQSPEELERMFQALV